MIGATKSLSIPIDSVFGILRCDLSLIAKQFLGNVVYSCDTMRGLLRDRRMLPSKEISGYMKGQS